MFHRLLPLDHRLLILLVIALMPLFLLASRTTAEFVVIITDIAFLYQCYRSRDWKWLSQTWFLLGLVFWSYLLFINVPLSSDRTESLTYAFLFLRWPLFAAALGYWLLASNARKRVLLLALVILVIFVMFDCAWQYIFGQDILGHSKWNPQRLTGPFHKPVPGIMILRCLFIVAFLGFTWSWLRMPIRNILFFLVFFSSGLLFMMITGERMALMLFALGIITVAIAMLFAYRAYRLKIMLGLGIIILLGVVMAWLDPITAQRSFYSIFYKLSGFYSSDYGKVFRAAYAVWLESPLTGQGWHQFRDACETMGLLNTWGMSCTHPHNLYLQILSDGGLIGLMLFLSMLGALYRHALIPFIHAKEWIQASVAFSVLTVSFWPITGGISLLNNAVAPVVWLGAGWIIAEGRALKQKHPMLD